MTDSDKQMPTNAEFSTTITLQITIAIVIINIVLFFVICILYFHRKGYFGTGGARRSSRRLVFAPHEPSLPRRALHPSILTALPITIFRSEDFKDNEGIECAVCLCELTDGEKARLLPKCNHGFHVECIDMWFHSNSTCPLCRAAVSIESPMHIQVQAQTQTQAQAQPLDVPSSTSHLVIDIPRRLANGFSSLSNSPLPLSRMSPNSPLPTSRQAADGFRSPVLGRMRSLRRMLSRGSGKGAGPSFSPRGGTCDVELGGIEASKCQ